MVVPTERNLLILKLPDTCEIEFSQEQITEALIALDEYQLLERQLVQRLASISVRRSAIEAQLLLVESLIGSLEMRRQ